MAKAKKDVTEMDGNQFPKGFNFADLKSIISVMEESQTEINVSHWTFGIECTVFYKFYEYCISSVYSGNAV